MPSLRIALAGAALAATTATGPTACQPTADTTTPTQTTPTKAKIAKHNDEDPVVEYDAECDMNNHAVNVKPNTKQARDAAEKGCQNTGAAIDNAPWPSGVSVIPLPNH